MTKEQYKQIRLKAGATQQKMAKYLGVDRSSVSKYESGEIIPSGSAKLMYSLIDCDDPFKKFKEHVKSTLDLDI